MRCALPRAAPGLYMDPLYLTASSLPTHVEICRPPLHCAQKCKKPQRGRAEAFADREYSMTTRFAATEATRIKRNRLRLEGIDVCSCGLIGKVVPNLMNPFIFK